MNSGAPESAAPGTGDPIRVTTEVSLRRATPDDVEQVYVWRNNPRIVALSLSQTTVDYDTHVSWFKDSLANDQRSLWIIQTENEYPVGLVRLDLVNANVAEVTIYLDQDHCGHGIGTAVLQKISGVARNVWSNLKELIAYIRSDNNASLAAFKKAGFRGDIDAADNQVVEMVKELIAYDVASAENEENIRLYTHQSETHGKTPAALGWSSEAKQRLRFRVLSEIGIKASDSVLDVGCGFGDFFSWLRSWGYQGDYTGVDITESLLITARRIYPDASFYEADLLEYQRFDNGQFDYVVASGIFTYRVKGGMDYLQRTAERMFELSRVGCAFNCLSAWGGNTEPTEFTADPSTVFRLCRQITPWVSVRHDYHGGDFTVYLFHCQQGGGN